MRETDAGALKLERSINKVRDSFDSIESLLSLTNKLLSNEQESPELLNEIKVSQKNFILDSFKVNKFHKDYQEWQHNEKTLFIDTEVSAYNKRLGKMARLNDDIVESEKELDKLRKSINLPNFQFSMQSIAEYDNGSLLEFVDKDANGNLPSKVDLSSLFSLDSDSTLTTPNYTMFSDLLNLEYRLRMQRQIKYEVLSAVKQQLTAKNQKWSSRDLSLNQFVTRDLPNIFEEISKIKQSEYEDLKDYDNDEDEDADAELDDQGSIVDGFDEDENDVEDEDEEVDGERINENGQDYESETEPQQVHNQEERESAETFAQVIDDGVTSEVEQNPKDDVDMVDNEASREDTPIDHNTQQNVVDDGEIDEVMNIDA